MIRDERNETDEHAVHHEACLVQRIWVLEDKEQRRIEQRLDISVIIGHLSHQRGPVLAGIESRDACNAYFIGVDCGEFHAHSQQRLHDDVGCKHDEHNSAVAEISVKAL